MTKKSTDINYISKDLFPKSYQRTMIDDDYIKKLEQENQKLKEELEEYKNPIKYFKYANKNVTEENQQKEFVKYLEDEIKMYSNTYMGEMLKEIDEILSKYKEIIGGNNE